MWPEVLDDQFNADEEIKRLAASVKLKHIHVGSDVYLLMVNRRTQTPVLLSLWELYHIGLETVFSQVNVPRSLIDLNAKHFQANINRRTNFRNLTIRGTGVVSRNSS
jgi:hypothetical protein